MTAQWHFARKLPSDVVRNPISAEFFSEGAVQDAAVSLVRESLQNSMDARLRDVRGRPTGPVRVRFFTSGDEGGLSAEKASRWFESLRPHLAARGNGLRWSPGRKDRCPFLVVEDFGTTGLTGDDAAHDVREDAPNNFFNFFRAEGYTNKDGSDQGSWGVGKVVFNCASRINTFLALTIPSDDGIPRLMGRSILKFHRCEADRYKSDGYWGDPGPDDLIRPSRRQDEIRAVSRDFNLKRGNEAGLSVIIPWCSPRDGDDDVDHISEEHLLKAALEGFFWPIAFGNLEVEVEGPSGSILVKADTMAEVLRHRPGLAEVAKLVELASWGRGDGEARAHRLLRPAGQGAQRWSPEMIPPGVRDAVTSAIRGRGRVALTVPLRIRRKDEGGGGGGGGQDTQFTMYLEGAGEDRSRPVFIRDQLVISNANARCVPGVRALVVIDHPVLSRLLRDAETVAHTAWTPGTAHFKSRYSFGKSVIEFVRSGVAEVVHLAQQGDEKPDATATAEFFSLVEAGDDKASKGRGRKPGGSEAGGLTPVPDPGPSRASFRVHPVDGGFAVGPGPAALRPGDSLVIRPAYSVRRGSALSAYDPRDFDLESEDMTLAVEGARRVKAEGNMLMVELLASEFKVEVRGFDVDRDLEVDVRTVEAAHAEADQLDGSEATPP